MDNLDVEVLDGAEWQLIEDLAGVGKKLSDIVAADFFDDTVRVGEDHFPFSAHVDLLTHPLHLAPRRSTRYAQT